MAYCKSCGAYIPDGQSKCLACGYDEAAEQRKTSASSASAAAEQRRDARRDKGIDSDFLRQQLDEQRRRQQENSRKWAETEFAQRQKAREEQSRSFGADARTDRSYRQTVRNTEKQNDSGKILAALSYFSGLFILPYIFKKDDVFATYHAKQGLNLFVAGLIGDVAGGILGVGWVVTLARLYMIYKGVSNVVNDKKQPLPYIGEIIK